MRDRLEEVAEFEEGQNEFMAMRGVFTSFTNDKFLDGDTLPSDPLT